MITIFKLASSSVEFASLLSEAAGVLFSVLTGFSGYESILYVSGIICKSYEKPC